VSKEGPAKERLNQRSIAKGAARSQNMVLVAAQPGGGDGGGTNSCFIAA